MPSPVLVWFRDDHRIADHPALTAAVETGAPVLCAFIFDESSQGLRPLGGASRWWLHGSLGALGLALAERGAELRIFRGAATEVMQRIAAGVKPRAVFWSRRYQAAEIAIDQSIERQLTAAGIRVETSNGRLLHEPGALTTKSGTPFQVYGPYLRAVMAAPAPRKPLPAPKAIMGGTWPKALVKASATLESLSLEPRKPNWAQGFHDVWTRGEAAGQERLARFLKEAVRGYAENRNRPALLGTSRLSPHLRFGEVSPRQIWHAAKAAAEAGAVPEPDVEKLLGEVIWRDFSYGLLQRIPDLATAHYNPRFNRLRFRSDRADLEAWRQARTGYPIVDAGLRQLWRTGWMHNRVRMIVASFLVKNLLIDWRRGEEWFWDTLVDADPANNAFSWQWIAGSGPDSAPFHRIFNPVAQGQKFDPEGDYIRVHVPELSRLPASHIHRPWEASAAILRKAGITLGDTYPKPIVEHGETRDRALQAFRMSRDEAA